ncbi:hypothetical protein C453_16853 [Haloferax elongans ATCC BAA-1513]|uniref:DUF7982 domain-containing protein n=1 Tax=Haloferax elongans ATCC BAA-1513 TaxID=1230453 RepID=M0HI52_HALEO|nr:hypothetical protein [Haloferax elongans]ELZ82774.1 hypothetical protein C453_16853 [Haloferax elongans ATCC BAA-1513]
MQEETHATDTEDAQLDTDAEIAALRADNRRLRREYLRARQSQYRTSALALGAIGAVALVAAALLPALRTVFLVLGSIGIFGGVLLYFLTPDRLVPVSVGESAYHAHRETGTHLREELGLADESVYVPVGDDTGPEAKLFVPQLHDYEVPSRESLSEFFVDAGTPQSRGVALTPTGQRLVDELSVAATGDDADPEARFETLGDALVEQFELVDDVDLDIDADGGRATARLTGPAYGEADQFDHPSVSVLAVGLATTLGTPVRVGELLTNDSGTLVTFRF